MLVFLLFSTVNGQDFYGGNILIQKDSLPNLYKFGVELVVKTYARLDSQSMVISDLITGNVVFSGKLPKTKFIRYFPGDEDSLGLKVEDFTGYFTFPSSGYYKVSWSGLTRPLGLKNMSSSIGYLETLLLVDNSGNRLPEFQTVPNYQAFLGKTWNHAPFPVDVEKDSMSFELINTMVSSNVSVPNYSTPTSFSNFSVDATTSLINWTPSMLGLQGFVFKVSEYKNGVLRSQQLREYQVFVKQAKVDSFFISTSIFPNLSIQSSVGGRVSFQTNCVASNASVLNLKMVLTNLNSKATVIQADANSVFPDLGQFTLRLVFDSTSKQPSPYTICLTGQGLRGGVISSMDIPLKLYYSSTQSVSTFAPSSISVFPNPAKDKIYLNLEMPIKGKLKVEWVGLNGQLVQTEIIDNVESESVQLTNLPVSGMYFLKIVSSTGKSWTQKVVVSE